MLRAVWVDFYYEYNPSLSFKTQRILIDLAESRTCYMCVPVWHVRVRAASSGVVDLLV